MRTELSLREASVSGNSSVFLETLIFNPYVCEYFPHTWVFFAFKTSKGNTYTCGYLSGESFLSGKFLLVEILQYFWKLLFEIPMFVNTPLIHGSPLLFKTSKGNTHTCGYFSGESFLSGKLLLVEILEYFWKRLFESPMCAWNTPLMHGSPLLSKHLKGIPTLVNTNLENPLSQGSSVSGNPLVFLKLLFESPTCGILPSCMGLLYMYF
jgi:hypothetical protein